GSVKESAQVDGCDLAPEDPIDRYVGHRSAVASQRKRSGVGLKRRVVAHLFPGKLQVGTAAGYFDLAQTRTLYGELRLCGAVFAAPTSMAGDAERDRAGECRLAQERAEVYPFERGSAKHI